MTWNKILSILGLIGTFIVATIWLWNYVIQFLKKFPTIKKYLDKTYDILVFADKVIDSLIEERNRDQKNDSKFCNTMVTLDKFLDAVKAEFEQAGYSKDQYEAVADQVKEMAIKKLNKSPLQITFDKSIVMGKINIKF